MFNYVTSTKAERAKKEKGKKKEQCFTLIKTMDERS